jgi:hypothetical protein
VSFVKAKEERGVVCFDEGIHLGIDEAETSEVVIECGTTENGEEQFGRQIENEDGHDRYSRFWW